MSNARGGVGEASVQQEEGYEVKRQLLRDIVDDIKILEYDAHVAIAEQYPVGCTVTFMVGDNMCLAEVIGHAYGFSVFIKTKRSRKYSVDARRFLGDGLGRGRA